MRGRMDDRKSYATPLQLGDVMSGESVAKVLASNHPDYAEGDIVLAPTGWRTHALFGRHPPAQARSRRLRRLRPVSACSACRVHRLWRHASDRQAPARRNRGGRGGERAGRVAGRTNWPSSPAPGRSALPAARRNAPLSKTNCALTRRSITVAADFLAQLAAACPNGIDIYFEKCRG